MMMMPPPPTTVTLANLCSELAKADCDRLEHCGLLQAPFDKARCLIRQNTARCEPVRAAVERAVTAGEMSFFELAAATCRDHLGALDCMHGPDVAWFDEPECKAVFAGNAAENASCSLPFSCAGELYCATSADCPGTCKKLRGNNEECGFDDPCAAGFFCATPAMRCHARVALNAPCELSVNGNPCVDASFCDGSQPGGARCAQARGRATGCTSPYQCASGLKCISNLCSAGQENDTCGSVRDCLGLRHCSNGRCVSPKSPGDTCSTPLGCVEGFTCTSSAASMVCLARPGTGESCNAARACYLGRCVTGTCSDAAADGAECMAAEDCLPGRSCTDGHCSAAIACTN